MTFWLIMVPALIAGQPGATVPHWHRTHAGCHADEATHHLPPGSCLKAHGDARPATGRSNQPPPVRRGPRDERA